MPDLSALDPSLRTRLFECLRDGGWRRDFARKDLDRGLAYAHGSVISKLSISSDNRHELIIDADVRGTRRKPYRVGIEIFLGDPDLGEPGFTSSECSCPVGFQCKHGAAVLEYLSRHSEVLSPGGGNGDVVPAGLDRRTESWLGRLRNFSQSHGSRASGAEHDFLAYCIEPPPAYTRGRGHVLELHKATQRPKGGLRISEGRSKISFPNPPAYLSAEDFPIAALHLAMSPSHFESPQLRGEGWQPLIDRVLELGRLYHGTPGGEYRALQAGPPRPVRPVWRETEAGGSRPELDFGEAGRTGSILLPTEPPLYLDPENDLIGPLQSDVPVRVLETWTDGPEVPAERIDSLDEALSNFSAAPLPSPEQRPTETLKAAPPRARLEISHTEIGARHPLRTIVGRLRFHYHDSPPNDPLPDGATGRCSWVREGTRYVVERDPEAEHQCLRLLRSLGLETLGELFGPVDFAPTEQDLLTVENPFPSLESAWLSFLAEHADRLRADGWTIEVDPDTGLTIRDVEGFTPAIEAETDHGIDWFSFDLHTEIDGRRISLIPHIAEMIRLGLPDPDDPGLPEHLIFRTGEAEEGYIRLPARRFLEICHHVAHLFQGRPDADKPLHVDRLGAAGVAHALDLDDSETTRSLAKFGAQLHDIRGLPDHKPPAKLRADLRPYQLDGYRWLRFLAEHGLHGILADDMGLGKTIQTLAYLAATRPRLKKDRKPSLVIAPTSVVTNWLAEAGRFTPHLKTLLLHGNERKKRFADIPDADLVLTTYALLNRDHETLTAQDWHSVILDEAQAIKNPRTNAARHACSLRAEHRFCLSGTPMENHLGELWSLMRFLMPGFLGDHDTFRQNFRRPIERDRSPDAQRALNRRVAPLILRRSKDEVATDLPEKTEIVHPLTLSRHEADLYESVRALMDKRVRDAINEKGLGKSHIIVLDALLKLRQICCHPSLLKTDEAARVREATKMKYLTTDLLPTLLEEGRRILLFSQFTSVLDLISAHLSQSGTPFLMLTGATRDRARLVESFQHGDAPVFLISLKAGGTGLNLTAADTVIHYDPWWNPAAENQATDRAHRIGQTNPVFVHKLICSGTIEERILELQAHKSRIVESLLSEDTGKLRLDADTLSHLLAPLS